MVCESAHELYYSPPRTPRGRGIGSAKSLDSRGGLNSAGTETLSIENLEEHFASVQSARATASEKLRAALKLSSAPADGHSQEIQARTLWTLGDPQDIGSMMRGSCQPTSLRPMSQQCPLPTSRSPGEASKKVVIRDNTVRANEWISECTPKVSLMDNQKEVWIQEREAHRKRLRQRNQALRGCRRAMPFEEWLVEARQAEQVADEDIEEDTAGEAQKQLEQHLTQFVTAVIVKNQPQVGAPGEKATVHQLQNYMEDSGNPKWMKRFQVLGEEFCHERCDLVWNSHQEIERIVYVAALRLEARDGSHILAQFGHWKFGHVQPTGVLPAIKQIITESSEEAIQRLLKQDFAVFGNHVKLSPQVDVQTHWHQCPTFGMRTKYVRSVMEGKLEIARESVQFTKATPKGFVSGQDDDKARKKSFAVNSRMSMFHAQRSLRMSMFQRQKSLGHQESFKDRPEHRQSVSGRRPTLPALESNHGPRPKMPEMYLLWHGDEIGIFAWQTDEEFNDLQKGNGQSQLHRWVNSVSIDPTLMPPKPPKNQG